MSNIETTIHIDYFPCTEAGTLSVASSKETKASFSIVAPDVAVTLTFPRWNTHGLVPSSVRQLTNFGQVGLFRLDGSYMYHAEVRDDCVDQLKLDIQVRASGPK